MKAARSACMASEDHKRLYEKFGLKIYNIEEELGFPIYLLRMN